MPSLAQQAAASVRHPLTMTLLALTFTTGLIDAASYLGLGRVFTANMTGNVVLLGFGIAGAGGLPIVAPAVSMAAFVAGAGAGGVLATHTEHHHPLQVGSVLAIEVSLVALAAVLAATLHPHPKTVSADVVIALLALAMGVRSAVVRRIAVPDLSTVVLTMTLTGLASDARLTGGSGEGTARRSAAVIAMLAGAVAGALLLKTSLALPLALAAVLALIALLAYVPPRLRREAHGHAAG